MRKQGRLERPGAGAAERVFGESPSARLALVRAVWPRVVGSGLAGRTEISSLSDGFLRVRVADARWMRVLHRLRHRILGRLCGALGELAPKRLGFLEGLGPSPSGKEAAPAPPSTPATSTPPPGLQAAAQVIPDPDLRASFLAVAARYLQRARPGL
jgi:hypothetical protein